MEAVLARLPRRGVPMILRQVHEGITKPFSFSGMQKIVHTMRERLGLPATFTLDACRHGGMTELEEAELTDGQDRALSEHKSQQAYEGYAKRTMERALSATCKRLSGSPYFLQRRYSERHSAARSCLMPFAGWGNSAPRTSLYLRICVASPCSLKNFP
jgi:hypothetical protein